MDNLVPLKQAVTEFSERTGDQRYAESYERVRSHIGHGTARLGRNMIAVEKSGNRWVTSRGELDRAVAAQQQYQADLDQATRDYEERRIVPPRTTLVRWGSITNHGAGIRCTTAMQPGTPTSSTGSTATPNAATHASVS